jgi:hypothetical protein
MLKRILSGLPCGGGGTNPCTQFSFVLLCDHPPGGMSNNNTGGRYSKEVPPTILESNMSSQSGEHATPCNMAQSGVRHAIQWGPG